MVLSKVVSGVLTWLFKHSDNIFMSLKPVILSFGSLIKATTMTKEDTDVEKCDMSNNKQNNSSTRASHFSVHFFAFIARL